MKTQLLILLVLIYSCSNRQESSNNSTQTLVNNKPIEKPDTSHKSQNQISLLLKPGIGVDNIVLEKSNYSDILNFKNLSFVVDSGESIADGDSWACHEFHKEYYNEENGLTFVFSTPCFMEPNIPKKYTRSLGAIRINSNKSACFSNGLCIGTATYLEIEKAFGPLTSQNLDFISSRVKGVTFTFNKNKILSEVLINRPEK